MGVWDYDGARDACYMGEAAFDLGIKLRILWAFQKTYAINRQDSEK